MRIATSPVLPPGFSIERRGAEYIVTCRVCGTVWAIPIHVPTSAENGTEQSVNRHTSRYCAPLAAVNSR
jgi:uncharacterized Zn finger protein